MAVFLAPATISQTPTSQDLQAKFEQEPDVMRRARMLTELSRADFREIRDRVAAGKTADALKTLQQLVDDMQQCSTALDAKEPNPEGELPARRLVARAWQSSLPGAAHWQPHMLPRAGCDSASGSIVRSICPQTAPR